MTVFCGAATLAMTFWIFILAPSHSFALPPQSGLSAQYPSPSGRNETDDIDLAMYQRRQKNFMEYQHKLIVSDSDRLLRLATELQASMNQPGADPTPLQLRQLEAIEKLAHNIKSKMSYSMPAANPVSTFDVRSY